MNILITTFSFPSLKLGHYDGKFILAEAKAYAENGASVKVLTPHYPGAKKSESPQKGVEIIRFSYFFPNSWQRLKQPGKPIYDSKSILALIQLPILLTIFSLHILRFSKWADIIHAQWTITALLALPAKFIFKTPIAMTARGSDLRILPAWLNRFIHRHVTATIDCFGTQPNLEKLKKEFPSYYIKLPLVVDYHHPKNKVPEDIKRIINSSKKKFIIFYIGRYVAFKIAQDNLFLDLINAAPLLKNKIDFHVFFIGNGEEAILTQMTDQIRTNNITDCVTLLGSKMNIDDYLPWADLGIGGNALNAVSQEFIVANIPQMMPTGNENIDSLWENDRNILLVQPKSPVAMAEKIINFARSPMLQSDIKKFSFLDMSHYVATTSIGGQKYLNIFKKLITKY